MIETLLYAGSVWFHIALWFAASIFIAWVVLSTVVLFFLLLHDFYFWFSDWATDKYSEAEVNEDMAVTRFVRRWTGIRKASRV